MCNKFKLHQEVSQAVFHVAQSSWGGSIGFCWWIMDVRLLSGPSYGGNKTEVEPCSPPNDVTANPSSGRTDDCSTWCQIVFISLTLLVPQPCHRFLPMSP